MTLGNPETTAVQIAQESFEQFDGESATAITIAIATTATSTTTTTTTTTTTSSATSTTTATTSTITTATTSTTTTTSTTITTTTTTNTTLEVTKSPRHGHRTTLERASCRRAVNDKQAVATIAAAVHSLMMRRRHYLYQDNTLEPRRLRVR